MSENSVEDRELGPTYKSLFLAACGLISLAFGWWFTNFITYIDTLSARVSALEVGSTEAKWAVRINTEKLDKLSTHEDRLRALERDHDGKSPGRNDR